MKNGLSRKLEHVCTLNFSDGIPDVKKVTKSFKEFPGKNRLCGKLILLNTFLGERVSEFGWEWMGGGAV